MIYQLIHRMAVVFFFGFMPMGALIPIVELSKRDDVFVLFMLFSFTWVVYLNAWAKKAILMQLEENIPMREAWPKSRIALNVDLMMKLAFLPLVGFVFQRWINRGKDNREIRVDADDEN